jgi:cobalt-precorrin-5B (C1)-methyltransferase
MPVHQDLKLKLRHQSLRTGFSTGTAAAAAAAGALLALMNRGDSGPIEVPLPGGGSLTIPLAQQRRQDDRGEAIVIKQAGDDPDVTQGAAIGARVRWLNVSTLESEIRLRGGEGVGRVTKPGLAVAVGEPAINPVPRQMIRRTLENYWGKYCPGQPMRLEVEIFVPQGEELARKTLNPRLGIIGGISILGTTGLVKPFSHQAYRATIAVALRVARAAALSRVVLTTGGKSEDYCRLLSPELPEEAFIQMGDYVRFSVQLAGRMAFAEITVAVFFGKALKIAQGMGQTHASQGAVDLHLLADLTAATTGNASLAQEVSQANTGRGALEVLKRAGALQMVNVIGRRMHQALRAYAAVGTEITALIFDFDGSLLWRSNSK